MSIPGIAGGEAGAPPERADAVYDRFLREIWPLRADAARRRYLAAEVVTAATQHRIDPDLLFALVAVESTFNSTALSRKGARGLGQVMFSTARTVAPSIVRRPEDLYNVRRNLHVSALYLRQLLIEHDGDVRAALAAYRDGSSGVRVSPREDYRYVARICTYFASLKTRRDYRDLVAMEAGDTRTAEN
jgi:soluble lytic murein transglycosylase-like protein